MPCTCNPLQQGSCRTEAVSLRSSPSQVLLTSGSLATGSCEPCQGGNTAALSRSFCVPRDRLDRVNYEGTVRGEPSKRGARLKNEVGRAAQGAALFQSCGLDGLFDGGVRKSGNIRSADGRIAGEQNRNQNRAEAAASEAGRRAGHRAEKNR